MNFMGHDDIKYRNQPVPYLRKPGEIKTTFPGNKQQRKR